MPFLDHLLTYKTTAYNTRHQRGRRLSVGGLITPILCAAGVNPTDKRATEPGWMDIKFCKTNLLIEHKELDGRFQFKFTHPLAGPSKLLLPNPELTTVVRAEDQVQESADLGEPECYYFEEYEAPRMNPSVVAAHKRIGLLQKFNKWQGKAIEKMQKSMDKMVSKIKSLEKKVSGSSSKKKKAPMSSTFLRSRSFSPLQGGSLPKSLTEPLHFEPREGEDNSQRRRKSSKARRSSSTTGLDRVQTEETQLDRADGRVGLEEPSLRIRDLNTIQRLTRSTLGVDGTPMDSLLEHSGAYGTRSMEDLAHGRSSTGYAKEEGGSHLEDQLDHLLDQPVEFLNSTGQASTRSS
ncbi:unnamed protein product [Microthlaspi erraticum]|uniref:Arabidopsis retrotransposon Orf1 C-terminal domain-containing protein n=1 Tax=Microthlaspi erraticum TaxID=1685480 RepID=A0A6D2HHM6_9BRAS|nr:unnamed protein product [Microthlaspi erraticum]